MVTKAQTMPRANIDAMFKGYSPALTDARPCEWGTGSAAAAAKLVAGHQVCLHEAELGGAAGDKRTAQDNDEE
jgi:hypothetical protein